MTCKRLKFKNFNLTSTMNFIISHFNFYKDGSKKEKYKLNLFAIIKSYLYLILIDHFLISFDVYCAESSDLNLIEKESEYLLFQDLIETVNDMADKLTLGSKNTNYGVEFKDIDVPSTSETDDKEVPSTAETDNSSLNINSFEVRILNLEVFFLLALESLIPDVVKDYEKDKDLYNKVFDLIEEIKGKVKSYNKNLIGKIEKKMMKKQSAISTFNEKNQELETMTQDLQLVFKILKKEINFFKTLKSSDSLEILAEHIDSSLSDLDSKIKTLLNSLKSIKIFFFEDKTEVNTIYMILTKVLELSPEEFKKDKEVSKAISSLIY